MSIFFYYNFIYNALNIFLASGLTLTIFQLTILIKEVRLNEQ